MRHRDPCPRMGHDPARESNQNADGRDTGYARARSPASSDNLVPSCTARETPPRDGSQAVTDDGLLSAKNCRTAASPKAVTRST